jgi:phage tail sheath protein FI
MAAESVISPGVFMQENDQSLITQGPIEVGAAIIGPTVIGPVNNPTVVTSYSDYKSKFGGAFISGGSSYEYLTSIAALNYFEQGGDSLVVVRVASGAYTPATASIPSISFGNTIASFELETLSVGEIMNNSEAGALIQGGLTSGSSANVRWEIANVDTSSGIFSLNIRSGDDVNNNRSVLETWTALSLDPNQSNFISYVIGDQKMNPQLEMGGACAGNYYMQWSGSYANKSRYVRVKSVNLATPNFFNNIGQPASATYQGSLPQLGSGSLNGGFNGAEGAMFGGAQAGGVANYPLNMFEAISVIPSSHTLTGNTQGLAGTDYDLAINLLQNKDAYDFNVIYAPGINSQNAPDQINSILYLSQERGDCIAVVDMTGYGQSVGTVNNLASQYDNSYAATYWPWLQVRSKETGRLNFVPASTLVPAIYEYNDKVSAEWFAPAGLNRGNISVALQPERRLSQCDRDALYNGKINPIASFSGVGTVIYGQKTLQSRATALDRVNVRRLLIALKAYIGQIGEQLVFEPNTQVTRNKFLNQVNPYLEYVQQRQGLYAFQVVMDETNNTPDVIDRNQLVGSIYLQPTRTAEFITLDFNILPTGATFG